MAYLTVDVPNVASEVFDGEIVVANFVSGVYYALSGTAASIWLGIRAGHDTAELARWLAGHFGRDIGVISAEVDIFVAGLVEAGMAAPISDPPPGQPLPELTATDYLAPQIERHDDLQDLLLLDPVHDVAQAGWPHLPPEKT